MSASRCACPAAGRPEEPRILRRVREKLLALSYPQFQRCLQHLLEAMGYADVSATGRVRRRGHNSEGGADLVAWLEAGLTRFRIVAQAKQLTDSVQKRSVDELRGAALRLDARQGLILTTAGVSTLARAAAASVPSVPVRVVDGAELADLLVRHGVGVVRMEEGMAIDEDYWRRLSARREGTTHCDTAIGTSGNVDEPDTIRKESDHVACAEGGAPTIHVRMTVSLAGAGRGGKKAKG